jgi:hypothetical protein
MSVNQIIAMLDIYRGTFTQREIGTNSADEHFLIQRGLVSSVDGRLVPSIKGEKFINSIYSISNLV